MRRRSQVRSFTALSVSLLAVGLLSCSKESEGGGGPACMALEDYTASVTVAPSFATDIHPILSNTTAAMGCAQATLCHGNPSVAIDKLGAKMLPFADAAATRTALLGAPVNAPGMMMVVPGNVGASFLAYKISGVDGLSCVKSMCASGASAGVMKPCGDPMPTAGILSPADRIKILDWIALGAAN